MHEITVTRNDPEGCHEFFGGPFDGMRVASLPADCPGTYGHTHNWHMMTGDGRLSESRYIYRREIRGAQDGWHFLRAEKASLPV